MAMTTTACFQRMWNSHVVGNQNKHTERHETVSHLCEANLGDKPNLDVLVSDIIMLYPVLNNYHDVK